MSEQHTRPLTWFEFWICYHHGISITSAVLQKPGRLWVNLLVIISCEGLSIHLDVKWYWNRRALRMECCKKMEEFSISPTYTSYTFFRQAVKINNLMWHLQSPFLCPVSSGPSAHTLMHMFHILWSTSMQVFQPNTRTRHSPRTKHRKNPLVVQSLNVIPHAGMQVCLHNPTTVSSWWADASSMLRISTY